MVDIRDIVFCTIYRFRDVLLPYTRRRADNAFADGLLKASTTSISQPPVSVLSSERRFFVFSHLPLRFIYGHTPYSLTYIYPYVLRVYISEE